MFNELHYENINHLFKLFNELHTWKNKLFI
jgi:hypothetical protein